MIYMGNDTEVADMVCHMSERSITEIISHSPHLVIIKTRESGEKNLTAKNAKSAKI